MEIDKRQILDFLRSRGDHHMVEEADRRLPNRVDTDDHEQDGVLNELGIDVADLTQEGMW